MTNKEPSDERTSMEPGMMAKMPATSVTDARGDARWLMAVLRAAGVERRAARAIAVRSEIDVHELVSLLERDCPLHLALRIVAPVEVTK